MPLIRTQLYLDRVLTNIYHTSAGAVSIYSHMMAYGGRDDGLFRGAIMQSGGAFPLELPNATSFQQTFDSLLTNTSCSTTLSINATAVEQLDCIRALPIDVFRASVGSKTGQSIDGILTRTSIQLALPAGQYLKVPTIVGGKFSVSLEPFVFTYAAPLIADMLTGITSANTDEGTNSAPKGINTTDQLFEPLGRLKRN